MRIIDKTMANALLNGHNTSLGNSMVADGVLYLHGNAIAKYKDGVLSITNAGWPTATIKSRLNALNGVNIIVKSGQWYLNGKPWSGEWVTV